MISRTLVAVIIVVIALVSAMYIYAYRTEPVYSTIHNQKSSEAVASQPESPPANGKRPSNVLPSDSADHLPAGIDGDTRYSWPPQIENQIWEFFANWRGAKIVSINSVECTQNTCTIEFAGVDPNPQVVDSISGLVDEMDGQGWGISSAATTTREIAPGARVFAISISNIPVDSSTWMKRAEADFDSLRETGQADPGN